MSRTFFWRELRRQAAAGLGMLILAVLLLTGTLAFGNLHSLHPITGFCLLIVPALLGVYAFGPDLEAGQERFLAVLPLSRAKLGALRLGTAASVVLAVDGLIFASFMAFTPGLSGRESSDLAAWFAGSLLLLPLGALLSVTFRHTLAALGATLSLVALSPTLIDLFEDVLYTRFDEVLISGLLVGWIGAALWLYGRTRALPPLRVAVPLGAAALVVGFLPAPAYGAFRYLTEDDARHYGYRGTQLIAAPEGDALAVLRSDPQAAQRLAVGVWRAGEERPVFVDYGEPLWLGDWLVTSAVWEGEGVSLYDTSGDSLRHFEGTLTDRWGDPDHPLAPSRERLRHSPGSSDGLILDRVGDDLWAIPAVGREGGGAPDYHVRLHGTLEWEDAGYCAKNLTQGTRWTPPAGWLVESLVSGWALLRGADGTRLQHLISGASFDPQRDLPAELRTLSLQLLRVNGCAVLVGLTDDEAPVLWYRDLQQPQRSQRVALPHLPRGGQVFLHTPGGYLCFTYYVKNPSQPSQGTRFSTWAVDGSSAPTPLSEGRRPVLWGPTPEAHLFLSQEHSHRPLYLRGRGGSTSTPVELSDVELNDYSLCLRRDGALLVAHEHTGNLYEVDEQGQLGRKHELGLPQDWRRP